MIAENSIAALRFLLQDDIYLLQADKAQLHNPTLVTTEAPLAKAATTVTEQPAEPEATVTVVPEATPSVAEHTTLTPAFEYRGGNQKHFLVIGHYPQEQWMADAHLKALESTLSRINFTADDVALLNLATCRDTDFKQITDYFKPGKLLILGALARPANLPDLPLNAVQTINGCIALYTYSFDEMMGHKENTKAFWNQIKTF